MVCGVHGQCCREASGEDQSSLGTYASTDIQKAQHHGGNAERVTVIWLLQVHLGLEWKA